MGGVVRRRVSISEREYCGVTSFFSTRAEKKRKKEKKHLDYLNPDKVKPWTLGV